MWTLEQLVEAFALLGKVKWENNAGQRYRLTHESEINGNRWGRQHLSPYCGCVSFYDSDHEAACLIQDAAIERLAEKWPLLKIQRYFGEVRDEDGSWSVHERLDGTGLFGLGDNLPAALIASLKTLKENDDG